MYEYKFGEAEGGLAQSCNVSAVYSENSCKPLGQQTHNSCEVLHMWGAKGSKRPSNAECWLLKIINQQQTACISFDI